MEKKEENIGQEQQIGKKDFACRKIKQQHSGKKINTKKNRKMTINRWNRADEAKGQKNGS